jgi:hypothetical protein
MAENQAHAEEFEEWLEKSPAEYFTMTIIDGIRVIAFRIDEEYDA